MRCRRLALAFAVLSLTTVALGLAYVAGLTGLVWAASPEEALAILTVDPSSAPNDLDTTLVISGTGFSAVPTVTLDSRVLERVGWVSSVRLTATVPWRMDAGVYTLTVTNPDGEVGMLTDAFTVTQGIGVWNPGKLYGGWVREVLVNPVNTSTLYATAVGVGLFRSRDSAGQWSFLPSAWGACGESRLALHIDSGNNRLYVGGCGIERSDDEGETWTPLTTVFPFTGPADARCHWPMQPYAHPAGGAVYAAACGRDGGPAGLIRSTDDGATWEPIMDGITDIDIQVTALAFHPADALTMFAGTADGHVFLTSDGGTTWDYASTPVPAVRELVVNPHSDQEVWAIPDGWFGDPCEVVPKSTSADLDSWTPAPLPPEANTCDLAIAFSPAVPATIYVASEGDGFISEDDGGEWAPFGPANAQAGAFIAHPTDPAVIYMVNTIEGVWKTADGGETWEVANEGLAAVFPEHLEIVPDRPQMVYAVDLPNRLFRGTRGGESWECLSIPIATCTLVDPLTTTRVYAGQQGRVAISEDDGGTWSSYGELLPPPQYPDAELNPSVLLAVEGEPVALLAGANYCSTDADCLGAIYRSTDAGETWQVVLPVTTDIGQLTDLDYDREITSVVYASTWGSGLWWSSNGGETWARIGESVAALDRAQDIAAEPRPPYRVFVWTDFSSGLWLSSDHGETWQEAGSWPGTIVHLLSTEDSPPALYAATTQGLHRSLDGAQSWLPVEGPLGWVSVYSLDSVAIGDRVVVYAGTTGGYVEDGTPGALSHVSAEDTLVNAGVYRYTTLRSWRVHLPLIMRQQ